MILSKIIANNRIDYVLLKRNEMASIGYRCGCILNQTWVPLECRLPAVQVVYITIQLTTYMCVCEVCIW